MDRQIWVKAYKGEAGTWYGASGQTVAINCRHSIVGYYNMSVSGQFLPLPGAEFSGSSPVAVPADMVQHGTVFPNSPQPNLALTPVIEIKDAVNQTSYFLDYQSYTDKIVGCNPVAYATSCPIVTSLSAGTPTSSAATITWTESPAIAGVEYVNNTSSSAPTGDGAFLVVGTGTVALTGLTATTTYHFWVRTICAGGVRSAWVSLTYATV